MSMHNKPLTVVEETGLIAHGFGREIGKASMAVDIFRIGLAWGQMSEIERVAAIQEQLDNGVPLNDHFRDRLSELLDCMITQS